METYKCPISMRIVEGILFLLSLCIMVLFFRWGFKKTKAASYISILTLPVFALHVFLEGIRWQLYPLYILVIICGLMSIFSVLGFFQYDKLYGSKLIRRLAKISMVVLVVLSMISAYAFPVYKMSKPNGPYKVGTITFDAVDAKRKAIYSDKADEDRKIRIQVWYPSDNIQGYKRVPWLEDGTVVAQGVPKMMGIPGFLLSHTALVQSNSYNGAPISDNEAQYPVVIISHGWTGFRNLHTDVAEMLASNGYIAVSIDHTYGAAVTVFGDGKTAYLNRAALPDRKITPDFIDYANTLVNTYAGDIEFTIDKLGELNSGKEESKLKDKMDLSNIGLLGHSTGGGAGVTTAIRDSRVKAVMGFDSWVEPIKDEDIQKGLKVPALFLRSEQWETGLNNKNLFSVIENSKEYKELYQIDGIIHQDFTMVYMYSPLSKYLGMTGKLDGWKGAVIQQDFVLNFFNRYLLKKAGAQEIQTVADKYKEVRKIK